MQEDEVLVQEGGVPGQQVRGEGSDVLSGYIGVPIQVIVSTKIT